MRSLLLACLAPILINAHSSVSTSTSRHALLHKRALAGCYADNPSSLPPTVNLIQSSAACTSTCVGMSYAIINGDTCWCSSTPPQQQIPDDTCNYICPGSSQDSCGGPNVYSLYARDGGVVSSDSKKASDTKSSPKPTETLPKTTKDSGSTSNGGKSTPDVDTRTVTAHGSTIIITSLITPIPSGSLTLSSFGTVFITTTVGGSNDNASTATATATASPYVNGSLPNSDLGSGANSTSSSTNSGLSKGGVAGIVISVLVVLAAALFFFGYRRRNRQSFTTARSTASTSSAEMAGVAATSSKWSTFRSRPAISTPFRGPLDFKQSHSDSLIPTTKVPKAAHFRRTSSVIGSHDEEVLQQVVLPVDHRLDPRTMLLRLRESPGGESQTSLRDNMDYSRRVLHVVNGNESADE